jgi:RimJ/RimL family protein N-acetyltransferase
VPPAIEGRRVSLRSFVAEDGPALLEALDETREDLVRWFSWGGDVRTLDDAVAWCAKAYGRFHSGEDFAFGVFERGTGRLLGRMDLQVKDARARVFETRNGWLRPGARGRDAIQETLRLLTELAFERLGAVRAIGRCDATNERSLRMMERAGYVFEARTRRSSLRPDGTLRDMLVHAMVREDFEAARAAWAAEDAAPPGTASPPRPAPRPRRLT